MATDFNGDWLEIPHIGQTLRLTEYCYGLDRMAGTAGIVVGYSVHGWPDTVLTICVQWQDGTQSVVTHGRHPFRLEGARHFAGRIYRPGGQEDATTTREQGGETL